MNTNISFILKTFTAAVIVVLFVLAHNASYPEDLIVGDWNESEWAYEKIENESIFDYDISDIKKHESELWLFKDNNKVEFLKEGVTIAEAKWTIKGRGHILKLDYDDGSEELFDIKELNEEELILNFDIGMETRGIAQLKFTR